MRKHIQNFRMSLVAMTLVIGIQFLLLPYYHYHPEITHAHTDQLTPHQHKGHYHSLTIENIVHQTSDHSASSHSEDSDHHHPHHPIASDGDQPDIQPNNKTLEPQKSHTVLKLVSNFSIHKFNPIPKASWFPAHFPDHRHSLDRQQVQERSPPLVPSI